MRMYCVLLLIVFATRLQITAQPGLLPELRGAVYRIEQPGQKTGTAVMFVEKTDNFLITNLHVVSDDKGIICDSIFLFLNTITNNKEIISGPEHITIYLKTKKDTFCFKSEIGNTDLILISLGTENLPENLKGKKLYKIYTSKIPKSTYLKSQIDSNLIFTAIGYPTKQILPSHFPRYPEYRWGRYVGQEHNYIKINIPVLHGSSGSPIFIEKKGNYLFVGIATLLIRDVCYALRSSDIRDCFRKYFEVIKKH